MNENIKNIIENYETLEKELIAQLNYTTSHETTVGGFREEIWKSLFERIIPKKFKIERSVFIIDSNGEFSNEVDLAIFDEQYTPYVFNYGKIKFIPVEAVAAVIECKSSGYDIKQIKKWVESINKLETSDESLVRTINQISFKNSIKTQTSTAPIKIFCHIPNSNKEKEISSKSLQKIGFDIIIEAKNEKMEIYFEHKNLYDWFEIINHKKGLNLDLDSIEFRNEKEKKNFKNFKSDMEKLKKINIEDYEISKYEEEKKEQIPLPLLSFIFQFNQLLMLLNNPMFFPHRAYVKLFNKKNEEDNK